MNILTYNEAIIKQQQGSVKILAFCVKRADCATCNNWLNAFWKDIDKKYNDRIEWYAINTDETEFPFPPQGSPTWYFYLSNYKDPFIRAGVLPEPEFSNSIDKLIRVQNGEDPFVVFK